MGQVDRKLLKATETEMWPRSKTEALESHSSALLLHQTLSCQSLQKQQQRNPVSCWPPQHHPSSAGSPQTSSHLPCPFWVTQPPGKACQEHHGQGCSLHKDNQAAAPVGAAPWEHLLGHWTSHEGWVSSITASWRARNGLMKHDGSTPRK